MFRRNLLVVWMGIISLSGMFLMGQDTWPLACVDNDADGYGDPASAFCAHPELDCDDNDASRHPGAPEICDGIDSDCDGVVDDDQDGDGAAVCDDCNDSNAAVYPGAPELCDMVDNQCPGDPGYGQVNEGCGGPMVEIPAGCFDMGDHFGEGLPDQRPVHNVCISAFEMDVHEVTNLEYKACVDAGWCSSPHYWHTHSRWSYYGNPAYDDFPVVWVDWFRATDYCTWAGKRLPTEAEWEYAARGGLAGKRYPWGDTISGADANYWDSGDPWDNDTSQVEYYAPNGYGLYDMAGNVWEWVNDWYQWDYYTVSPPNDPPGPVSGTTRVLRGGSCYDITGTLCVAVRSDDNPVDEYDHIGFRCAR